MPVADLIAALSGLPPELPVVVEIEDFSGSGVLEGVADAAVIRGAECSNGYRLPYPGARGEVPLVQLRLRVDMEAE